MSLILLVDDDRDLRDVYTEVLEGLGHVVVTAGEGRAALQEARRVRPDLLITDYNMPVMNGAELCRRVREDPQLRATPILMHSGSENRCPELLTAFLPKPCSLEVFEAHVKRALEERWRRRPTSSSCVTPTLSGRGLRDGSRASVCPPS